MNMFFDLSGTSVCGGSAEFQLDKNTKLIACDHATFSMDPSKIKYNFGVKYEFKF